MNKRKLCHNAKDLKDFLNKFQDEELKQMYIISTYSDDVSGGEAKVTAFHLGTDDVGLEIVGGSEMV